MQDQNITKALQDIFLPLDKRQNKAYFLRLPGYNDTVKDFALKAYNAAKTKGTVFTEKLSSPDERQVTYYTEILGNEFSLDKNFIGRCVSRFLPELNNKVCITLSDAVFWALSDFKSMGKTDAMLRNMFVQLMCWFFYKVRAVLPHICDNDPPLILCSGNITRHQLYLLKIFHLCRCDVVILLYDGDKTYNSLDPNGRLSQSVNLPGMQPYPQGFSIKQLENARTAAAKQSQLYGFAPEISAATNVWLKGNSILADIEMPPVNRGKEGKVFYNAFCRMTGVPDKLTYQSELYKFYSNLNSSGRRFIIEENKLPVPDGRDIDHINRGPFHSTEEMVSSMLKYIKMPPDGELKKLITKTFIDIIFEESRKPDMKAPRLTTMAVCCVYWINLYGPKLFNSWILPMVSLFIYLGGCKTCHEAAFLRILSRLPCDVLILAPNLNSKCLLSDDKLYELRYGDSLNITEYPKDSGSLLVGTAAYHAERDLDKDLYQDSGIYRDYQYQKANSIILKTMYEEIDILWKQESKFRPNFDVINNVVNVPVIFAKISGVRDSAPNKYWKSVQKLITENTFLITDVPLVSPQAQNPMKIHCASYIQGGKIKRSHLYSAPEYQYGHLRRETQEYIFDKIDLLMNTSIIKGTFQNGMEYLIAATLLNLPAPIVRLIQGFDFTKVSPKIIYINSGETQISAEDAIIMAFLSLVGFDVLFFVPTGYQTVESYFDKNIMAEHKIGEYMYDLRPPTFKIPKGATLAKKNKSLFGNLFKN